MMIRIPAADFAGTGPYTVFEVTLSESNLRELADMGPELRLHSGLVKNMPAYTLRVVVEPDEKHYARPEVRGHLVP